jgi:hypothetical protein
MSAGKPTRKSNRITRWLHEPLVHFLVIGALFFIVFHYWGRGGPGTNRIVITPGQIDSLIAQFTRTWQRPPTDQELKGLVDDHVRNEIAAREAMAMGLDRDDTIIRRRLRQKLEFMAEDAVDIAPPTDEELRAWLNENVKDYRIEPRIGFRQVYLNTEERGASVQEDAQRIIGELVQAGADADIDTVGDQLMLPNTAPLSPLSDVARTFGRQFADAIFKLEPGRWTGPVFSGYGLHIVYVTARKPHRIPAFDEVRSQVERDFTAARRKRALDAMYEGMLQRYKVTMEQRGGETDTARAATEPVK